MKYIVFILILLSLTCASQQQPSPQNAPESRPIIRDTIRLVEIPHESRFLETGGSTMGSQHGQVWCARIRYGYKVSRNSSLSYSLTVKTNWSKRQYTIPGMPGMLSPPYLVTETFGHMWYLGFHYDWVSWTRTLSPYLSVAVVIGDFATTRNSWSVGSDGSAMLVGIEPELGMQYRPFDFMAVRGGIGTLGALNIGEHSRNPGLKAVKFYADIRWLF